MDKEQSVDSSELNHVSYGEGCKNFDRAEYSKAQSSFRESLRYWPEDPEAWLALGNCYNELHKPNSAEKCYRKALIYCKPEDSDGYNYNLGNSLFDQEKYTEAMSCYQLIKQKSDVFKKAQINMKLLKLKLSVK